MGYYDLTKKQRAEKTAFIQTELYGALLKEDTSVTESYFNDRDLYIRKAAYLGAGRVYGANAALRATLVAQLKKLQEHPDELVRQTVVNTAGEIGTFHFKTVKPFFDRALFDPHHKVRNAVIGSLKKMGQKNPGPVLTWAKGYINHPDKEIRREVCHGIELRGRTHPQDILPILAKLQFEKTKRVRTTLVHVLGQISYKKGCLPIVVKTLAAWGDKQLVEDAMAEIIDVHSLERYAKFTTMAQDEVVAYIAQHG
ncbi:MAG: HEAT repeat domain-containing protein [Marinirhabdus sp.]